MRRSLKLLVALCAAAAVAAAAGARQEGGLEVVSFNWKYDGYVPVEVVRNKKTGTTMIVKRGTDYVFKYRAQATIKNAGAKAVRAVEWDYLFVEPEGGRELKRYRLQSKQRIEPGASETLARDVFIKPGEETRHLTAGRQQVRVTRVEYADGTAWKAKE